MAAFQGDPTELIIGSVTVIVTTTIVRHFASGEAGKDSSKKWTPLVYGFILTLLLLLIATFAPNFARGLAIMGLVGAFAVNGPTIFELVGKLGK